MTVFVWQSSVRELRESVYVMKCCVYCDKKSALMTIVLMNSLLFDGGGEFEGGLFRLVVEFKTTKDKGRTCHNIVLTIICR